MDGMSASDGPFNEARRSLEAQGDIPGGNSAHAEGESGGLVNGLKNEASVFGKVVTDVPGAVWDEIRNDWNNHRGKLAAKEGISLAVGVGTGLALARAPFLMKTVLGAVFAYQGYEVASSAGSVIGRAWNAKTDASRRALANEAINGLSKAGADILETTPAFIAGGGAGLAASGEFAGPRRLAVAVQEHVNDPLKYGIQSSGIRFSSAAGELMPTTIRERFAWIGPGTKQLPTSLISAEGKINLLETTRLMADMHPTQDAATLGRSRFFSPPSANEQWASIRLPDMKVSRTYYGNDLGVKMPFADREGRVMFHTHPTEGMSATYPVAGARPSVPDLQSTADLGIIQSGPLTTIYQGASREYLASQLQQTSFRPTLRALIFDREQKLAAELATTATADGKSFEAAIVRPLDYARTEEMLSAWDVKTSNISDIPTDYNAMLNLSKPQAFEFLKLGVYKNAES